MPDNIDRSLGTNMSSVRSAMNNNNYLPSPTFTLMPSRLQTTGAVSTNMYPANSTQFTFGVPTQSPTITSSQQFTPMAPRGIVMPQNPAPGVGVSWQHTVPKKMPWSESTGMQFTSSPITSAPKVSFSSTSTFNKPTSSSTYRPKRHHVSFDDECRAPPIKRFLSEEKMAASMQNLYIGNVPNNSARLPGKDNSFDTTASWEKFFKLEERLKDEDLIEEEPIVRNVKKNTKFKISEAVKDSLFTQEPLLPPKVLENLNKKAMEVVLWKPPEGVVNEILDKVKKGDNLSEKNLKNGSTDNMINESIVNGKSLFSYGMNDVTNEMDVDMFDNIDDEMGL